MKSRVQNQDKSVQNHTKLLKEGISRLVPLNSLNNERIQTIDLQAF